MKAGMDIDLFRVAQTCLEETDVNKKVAMSVDTTNKCLNTLLLIKTAVTAQCTAGRPERPKLVSPGRLPRRGFSTKEARLALVHAITHIEFNAINLAWDAIYRFQDMPEAYYLDWLSIAAEETKHFTLLRNYLLAESCDYGDFDAHDGLWTIAENTATDVLHRMAIVPRVLEARGLDVTPAMIEKFAKVNDKNIVDILELIYIEEIGHVQIGNRWFRYLCAERGLEPEETFVELVKKFGLDEFRGAINRTARHKAGFSQHELDFIQSEFVKV